MAALSAALDAISAQAHPAVDDLTRMIAVDTRFPPGAGYADFADLMDSLVAPLGLPTTRVTVPRALWHVPGGPAEGERVNLVAGPRATGRPALGLYFHTDTVPDAAGWTRPPLRLTREGDRLHGLGAADMKGCIAAVLLALRAAAACGVALAYDPVLLLCTDEEGGLYPGIRHLAEQGMLPPHILNFNGTAAPRIWAGCFGLFNLEVRLQGRASHASDTAGAVNAIEAALPVLQALLALKARVATRISALPPPPAGLGGSPGQPLAASLAVATAQGGTAGGQVPDRFVLTVNRRYPPEEDFSQARAEIEAVVCAAVAETPGLAVEFALTGHLIPTADPTGPHWPRWQRALCLGFGYGPEDFRAWGSNSCSDFGYVQQAGLQEVLLGGLARPDSRIHSADEFTTIPDLVALARSVLAYLAADFAPDLLPESQDDP